MLHADLCGCVLRLRAERSRSHIEIYIDCRTLLMESSVKRREKLWEKKTKKSSPDVMLTHCFMVMLVWKWFCRGQNESKPQVCYGGVTDNELTCKCARRTSITGSGVVAYATWRAERAIYKYTLFCRMLHGCVDKVCKTLNGNMKMKSNVIIWKRQKTHSKSIPNKKENPSTLQS